MDMSFAALALHLSMRDTGTLVTPYEAQEARAAAIARYGFDGLRGEVRKRAWFSSTVEPDEHCDRFAWAQAAAAFVEEP